MICNFQLIRNGNCVPFLPTLAARKEKKDRIAKLKEEKKEARLRKKEEIKRKKQEKREIKLREKGQSGWNSKFDGSTINSEMSTMKDLDEDLDEDLDDLLNDDRIKMFTEYEKQKG